MGDSHNGSVFSIQRSRGAYRAASSVLALLTPVGICASFLGLAAVTGLILGNFDKGTAQKDILFTLGFGIAAPLVSLAALALFASAMRLAAVAALALATTCALTVFLVFLQRVANGLNEHSMILLAAIGAAFILLARGLSGLFLTPQERMIVSAFAPHEGVAQRLLNPINLWPGYRQSTFSAIIAYLATGFGAVFQGISTFLLVSFVAKLILGPSILIFALITNVIYPFRIIGPFLADLFVFFALAVVIVKVGIIFKRLARAASRRSYAAQVVNDPRPPILFLRSFRDDQVTLRQQGLINHYFRAEPTKHRLDHLLVEEFSRYGPVVAIGRPGEKDLPFGAARTYVPDDHWRDEVTTLACSARAVVIVVDETDGVEWETSVMLQPEFVGKTLFLAAPTTAQPNLADNAAFAQGSANSGFSSTDSPIFAAFRPQAAWTTLTGSKSSPEDYRLALRAFFRSAGKQHAN